eukprot:TRINITY_DN8186_c0_g1_i2.p1 TRINITY_DN8186_c0_g1~~TRINITY_DN8186_c0_g1_i2.p1  ORF type:complete len:1352 (+),score=151.85 TRINITY_DN8186_c0_g1_i2:85-4140(+)
MLLPALLPLSARAGYAVAASCTFPLAKLNSHKECGVAGYDLQLGNVARAINGVASVCLSSTGSRSHCGNFRVRSSGGSDSGWSILKCALQGKCYSGGFDAGARDGVDTLTPDWDSGCRTVSGVPLLYNARSSVSVSFKVNGSTSCTVSLDGPTEASTKPSAGCYWDKRTLWWTDGSVLTYMDTAQWESVCDAPPPTAAPSFSPPSFSPSAPSVPPSASPSVPPSPQPTDAPVTAPPTSAPVPPGDPTRPPVPPPTAVPTQAPSTVPPTSAPTTAPSVAPSRRPSTAPTKGPTARTEFPTWSPLTAHPSQAPAPPTAAPSVRPTRAPSAVPSRNPSAAPTAAPEPSPTLPPTRAPSSPPSRAPQDPPSRSPSSAAPSVTPTIGPTAQAAPTGSPTFSPSTSPSRPPSTSLPSTGPSAAPTSTQPTGLPSRTPSALPSSVPSLAPSQAPSLAPSVKPSSRPSAPPTRAPTPGSRAPSAPPSKGPVVVTRPPGKPTGAPLPPFGEPTPSPLPPSWQPTGPPAPPPGAPTLPPLPETWGPTGQPVPPPGAPTNAPARGSGSPLPGGVSSRSPASASAAPSTGASRAPGRTPTPTSAPSAHAPPPREATITAVVVEAPPPSAASPAIGTVTDVAADLAEGAAILAMNGAGAAGVARIAVVLTGCNTDEEVEDTLPQYLHPTHLRLNGFALPVHAGCIAGNAAAAAAVALLHFAATAVLRCGRGMTRRRAEGAVRFPSGTLIAAFVFSQGASLAGARILRHADGAADVALGVPGVLWGLLLPIMIFRSGHKAQRAAVYKLDPEAVGGCRRRWLGPGEWFSAPAGLWKVERWGVAFRAALPGKHSVLALDMLLSELAMLNGGFGGGSCISCAWQRLVDVVLALVLLVAAVHARPYARPLRLHLVVLSLTSLMAGSAAVTAGFYSAECSSRVSATELPGHDVAAIFLVTGLLATIGALAVDLSAMLRAQLLERRDNLRESLTHLLDAFGREQVLQEDAFPEALAKKLRSPPPPEALAAIFATLDTDKDRRVTLRELLQREYLLWEAVPTEPGDIGESPCGSSASQASSGRLIGSFVSAGSSPGAAQPPSAAVAAGGGRRGTPRQRTRPPVLRVASGDDLVQQPTQPLLPLGQQVETSPRTAHSPGTALSVLHQTHTHTSPSRSARSPAPQPYGFDFREKSITELEIDALFGSVSRTSTGNPMLSPADTLDLSFGQPAAAAAGYRKSTKASGLSPVAAPRRRSYQRLPRDAPTPVTERAESTESLGESTEAGTGITSPTARTHRRRHRRTCPSPEGRPLLADGRFSAAVAAGPADQAAVTPHRKRRHHREQSSGRVSPKGARRGKEHDGGRTASNKHDVV